MGEMKSYADLYAALKAASVRWESLSHLGDREFSITSWQSPREVADGLKRAGFSVERVEPLPEENMVTYACFTMPTQERPDAPST